MAKKAPKKKALKNALNRNVARLANRLEAANLQDYIDLTNRPFRMIWINFLSGMARGVGMFVGAGAMGALVIAVVGILMVWLLNFLNMFPVIGDLVTSLKTMVQDFMQQHKSN